MLKLLKGISKLPSAKMCLAILIAFGGVFALPLRCLASEADIKIPSTFYTHTFSAFGGIQGTSLLYLGIFISLLGVVFALMQAKQLKSLPVHSSMLEISELIFKTCRAYLLQQGRFLIYLEILIGVCIIYYFGVLSEMSVFRVFVILLASVLGILGSFGVAWFGIRINNYANSRTAFASLEGKPYPCHVIPLKAGMSIGLLLICVELITMLCILLFLPDDLVGPSFIGFAIGESLGASALRVAGGIFTKIADIGADLMKIVFNIKEDDARNPGVIADCTGDNAGDSVGPTADGFETYGVTGVALIVFITLAVSRPELQAALLIWIFVMRVMMIVTSVISYLGNGNLSATRFKEAKYMDFEAPLTSLVWITSILSIAATFGVSHLLLQDQQGDLWWKLSTIISCGTLMAAVLPELTKVFTSANSTHVKEIVNSSREGGASLTILSGMVAGNFSCLWIGASLIILMAIAYATANTLPTGIMEYPSVFAFGLVAFGMLGMGPVTIAVDSYGPVTDNAQSVYELSLIEEVKGIKNTLQKDFSIIVDFKKAKHLLEDNDGAGNTFKATAKPVLIGTAVVGATTMIFSIILAIQHTFPKEMMQLSLIDPKILLGLMTGGAVIYWFCGASMQAVTTGAYRAVEFIKSNIKLDSGKNRASDEDSTKVVTICTQYAQSGMINIFVTVFFLTLSFAFMNPFFFVAYLISIALFGLYQAIYMANAGGSWDNAKKVVEVDLKEKGTPLHSATVIGDTVGDPYKDTSSVALNPIIKFTTLFGLLAVEIALQMTVNGQDSTKNMLAIIFLIIGVIFAWRSFYKMRISTKVRHS